MAGSYVFKSYQFDDYQSYAAVRVQPETLTFEALYYRNDGSGQDYTQYPFIKTRGSRRGYSAFTGAIKFKWIDARPEGYTSGSELRIPVLLAYQRSIYQVGVEGTYQGYPVIITRVIPEFIP